jgi:WD40 repeat protein
VNFLGPNDEFVASGSDDGNFFIWDKHDGKLQGIYEGDSSVVNIIEGHPYFPLVAVSGIDTTVKVRVLSFKPRETHLPIFVNLSCLDLRIHEACSREWIMQSGF